MAYMSQENKKDIAPQIKAVLKKYKMKGSISVKNHSTLSVTLKSGDIPLEVNGNTVNTYWLDDHFAGAPLAFFKELKDAMNGEGSKGNQNFDKSDIQSDYFNVGWYIDISVGKWNKPFVFTG